MFNTVFNAWSSFAVGLWGVVPAQAPSRGEFTSGQHKEGEHVLDYRLFIPGDARGRPMPVPWPKNTDAWSCIPSNLPARTGTGAGTGTIRTTNGAAKASLR